VSPVSEEKDKKDDEWTCYGGVCIRGDIRESTKLYNKLLEKGIIV